MLVLQYQKVWLVVWGGERQKLCRVKYGLGSDERHLITVRRLFHISTWTSPLCTLAINISYISFFRFLVLVPTLDRHITATVPYFHRSTDTSVTVWLLILNSSTLLLFCRQVKIFHPQIAVSWWNLIFPKELGLSLGLHPDEQTVQPPRDCLQEYHGCCALVLYVREVKVVVQLLLSGRRKKITLPVAMFPPGNLLSGSCGIHFNSRKTLKVAFLVDNIKTRPDLNLACGCCPHGMSKDSLRLMRNSILSIAKDYALFNFALFCGWSACLPVHTPFLQYASQYFPPVMESVG